MISQKNVQNQQHIADEKALDLMTAIVDPQLCKEFYYKNNELEKSSRVTKAEYSAIAVQADLEMVYTACEHGQITLILGHLPESVENDGVQLLSRKRYAADFGDASQMLHRDSDSGIWIATRTKDNFEAAPILLIDHDVNSATPELFRNLTPDELIRLLARVMPEFGAAGYVLNYGSSAGLIAPDGSQLTGLGSFHLYFQTKDSIDIQRFKEVLAARCVLAGLWWYRTFADGRKTIETVFDLKAVSRERLCYEAKPILHDGLTRNGVAPAHVAGEVLDTQLLLNLTVEELAELAALTGTPKATVSKVRPGSSIIGVTHSEGELKLETEIVLADGTKTTVKAFLESGVEKTPCFAPFRDDRNASAFIARHSEKPDVIFVHDTGRSITYFLKPIDNQEKTDDLPFKGEPATLEAMSEFLEMHAVSVRYNLIKKDLEIVVPNCDFSPDNVKNASLAVVESLAAGSGLAISGNKLRSYLLTIGDMQRFNPVLNWIESKPWDGIDRMATLASKLTVEAGQEAYRDIVLKRWSLGAIAVIAIERGVKNELVLVLSGDQGIGKTSFFRSLALAEFVLDGHLLNPSDKDSVKLAISHWLVEMGELDATFRKSDIAALKAFLSKDRDELRLPYAPATSVFPRRTAFCASVNEANFLVDHTGNRRYAALEILKIDRSIIVDMQQYWAQVLDLYNSGEQWWLTETETAMQATSNAQFEVESPLKDKILAAYDFENAISLAKGPELTASGVLLDIGIQNPTPSDATKAGIILKKLGLTSIKKGGGKVYHMPAKKVFGAFLNPL